MTCDKVTYKTQTEAKKAISGMNKTRKRHQYSYYCKGCNGWHTATKQKKFQPVLPTPVHIAREPKKFVNLMIRN